MGHQDDNLAAALARRFVTAANGSRTRRPAPVLQETINHAERIERLLALFRQCSSPATLTDSTTGQMFAAGWGRSGLLVSPEALALASCKQIGVVTSLDWATYEWTAPGLEGLATPPPAITRFRKRHTRRLPMQRGVVACVRPARGLGTAVYGRVVDASLDGLGIELYPGYRVPELDACVEIDVEWNGGTSLCGQGIVRHHAPRASSTACGIEWHDPPTSWQSVLEPLMHPVTRRGDIDGLWELYESSGYFSLSGKLRDHFFHLRHDFVAANHRLANSPDLGGVFAHESHGRAIAAMSQLQFWPGSWLGYQLARTQFHRPLHASGHDILAELYQHSYEHVQQMPGTRWLVSYVQDSASWSRAVNLDLTARYVPSGRSSITRFVAVELRSDLMGEPCTRTDAPELALANREEAELITQHIRRRYPLPYIHATGLDAPLTAIDSMRERWSAAGLTRERVVFVTRHDERPTAAMVLDCGHRGLHLFHLTQMCRVWALTPAGHSHLSALVEQARRWFHERGHEHFVLFWEHDDPPPDFAGARDLGRASTIVLDATLIPELLEHVRTTLVTSPLRKMTRSVDPTTP